MSELMPSPIGPDRGEMIVKLISAGYLRPDQRHDPDAITNAIVRMRRDLRTRNGSDGPIAA